MIFDINPSSVQKVLDEGLFNGDRNEYHIFCKGLMKAYVEKCKEFDEVVKEAIHISNEASRNVNLGLDAERTWIALLVGAKLFDLEVINSSEASCGRTHRYRLNRNASWNLTSIKCFAEWLCSSDGVHAVKVRMVERGYSLSAWLAPSANAWRCEFVRLDNSYHSRGDSESDAVLKSSWGALQNE